MAHNHLAQLFVCSAARASLLSLLACTIPKDIDMSIGTVEILISQQLKMQKSDHDIYEFLRMKAQERRWQPSSGMQNFSKRSKNRASDLVEIMKPLTVNASPQSLVDVGCAEGFEAFSSFLHF